jgi:hypothetical protein
MHFLLFILSVYLKKYESISSPQFNTFKLFLDNILFILFFELYLKFSYSSSFSIDFDFVLLSKYFLFLFIILGNFKVSCNE